MNSNKEVIIIGSGPAGLSAAIYTQRAGIKTTVIGRDEGTLGKVDHIENYFGFAEMITGRELLEQGYRQVRRLGGEIVADEVLGLDFADKLVVQTLQGTYRADALILATGAQRTRIRLEGLERLEGLGVSYCATCDGFFYRGKDVAVLGSGEYALHEAQALLPIATSVTLLTNGEPLKMELPEGLQVNDKILTAVNGEQSVSGVEFKDGSQFPVAGLFVALGVAGSSALAKKLGAQTVGNTIVVDENMFTGIPGLYAAGDCTGGLLQIAKAVYEGAVAGLAVNKYLRSL